MDSKPAKQSEKKRHSISKSGNSSALEASTPSAEMYPFELCE